MWPYLATLAALLALAWLSDDRMARGVMSALAGNWCVNTAIVWYTGNPVPWAAFIVTDYLTGFFLLLICPKASPFCIAVVALYVGECLAHGAFGMSRQDAWAEYSYWWTLSYAAWAQLFVMGVWGLADIYRRIVKPAGGGASGVAHMGRDSAPPGES
ncbi:hypothetical protein BH11PSE6_BH11PSE6_00040 [soil metagenome]